MVQHFRNVFQYCPTCGTQADTPTAGPFICPKCDFHFYFPPTIAVGAIIEDQQSRILFIERAKDPGKGKLGLPGGFVDPGETGEAAVIREIQEEVGLESGTPEYLVSYPNIYDYKGVRNDVLDLFYRCKVESFDELTLDPAEVSNFSFLKPDEAVLNRMAFESNKLAIQFRLKMS